MQVRGGAVTKCFRRYAGIAAGTNVHRQPVGRAAADSCLRTRAG